LSFGGDATKKGEKRGRIGYENTKGPTKRESPRKEKEAKNLYRTSTVFEKKGWEEDRRELSQPRKEREKTANTSILGRQKRGIIKEGKNRAVVTF